MYISHKSGYAWNIKCFLKYPSCNMRGCWKQGDRAISDSMPVRAGWSFFGATVLTVLTFFYFYQQLSGGNITRTQHSVQVERSDITKVQSTKIV